MHRFLLEPLTKQCTHHKGNRVILLHRDVGVLSRTSLTVSVEWRWVGSLQNHQAWSHGENGELRAQLEV